MYIFFRARWVLTRWGRRPGSRTPILTPIHSIACISAQADAHWHCCAIAADQNLGLYNHIVDGKKFTITWTVMQSLCRLTLRPLNKYLVASGAREWTTHKGPPATEQYSFLPSLTAKSSGSPPQFEVVPWFEKSRQNTSLQNNLIEGTATLWRERCLSANKCLKMRKKIK
jgi:hypothetical protein